MRSPAHGAIRAGLLAVTLTTGLLLTGVLLLAPAASAHDVLISTVPASGSTTAQAPGQVVLTFDRPALALGTQIRVTGPAGTIVSAGKPRLVDSTVTQDLAGTLPAGEYAVTWRVTSADGHPVAGRFGFTTTAAGKGALASPPSPSPAAAAGDPAGSRLLPVSAAVLIAAAALAGWAIRRRRTGSSRH